MLAESKSRAFRTVLMVSVLAGNISFITGDQLFQGVVRRLRIILLGCLRTASEEVPRDAGAGQRDATPDKPAASMVVFGSPPGLPARIKLGGFRNGCAVA